MPVFIFRILIVYYILDITNIRGGQSICQWTVNEDFQYGISRFWEKYCRETVFSTLDGVGN